MTILAFYLLTSAFHIMQVEYIDGKKMSIWGTVTCEFSYLCLCDFSGWLKAKCEIFFLFLFDFNNFLSI